MNILWICVNAKRVSYHQETAACRALQRRRNVLCLSPQPQPETAALSALCHHLVTSSAKPGSDGGRNTTAPEDGKTHKYSEWNIWLWVGVLIYSLFVCFTCLNGVLAVGVGLSTDFSSSRRAPVLRFPAAFWETPNSSSQMSLTRSWMLMWCSPGDAHLALEMQGAGEMTRESSNVLASSSATQRWSLCTCRGLQLLFIS